MNDTTNYLIGFFHVEGHGKVTVETKLSGSGAHDYQELWKQVRAQYPDAGEKDITRTGSTIEARTPEGNEVKYAPGSTIQQLFLDMGDGDSACSRQIGRVDFSGQECDIILRFHRAKNSAGLTLLERVSKSSIRFSDNIPGMRLASDLSDLVKNIVGNDGRKLKLWLVESH
jgi:hypothetical protein